MQCSLCFVFVTNNSKSRFKIEIKIICWQIYSEYSTFEYAFNKRYTLAENNLSLKKFKWLYRYVTKYTVTFQ